MFLYAIAALNFAVLRGIFRTWCEAKEGRHQPEELEQLLADRGLMNRVFKGRYNKFIEHTWQLYFVGLLFGLGARGGAEGVRGRPCPRRVPGAPRGRWDRAVLRPG
ncbi:high-affinity nickel permease [Streptomyces canus]|uniref:HoxN/HupN/NixA family nickel/cobalt transporter n=1 Tax=Streptomyces canus TaxID=58343 RepID=UPI0027815508|nr:hypothetical protein [Streptomyces canus]MDQ0605027.1 high-affinity nickel permease [Streptomyces canus]